METMTMSTIKQLAEQMSQAFEVRTRDNGDKFRCLKDDCPEWMDDVVSDAHGSMLADDWRYEFIENAVDKISEADDDASDDDLSDLEYELEADVYTSDLTGWLHSRADRLGWLDQATEESGGEFDSAFNLLSAGQLLEKQEVFRLVLDSLRELASDEDEAEEESDED